ncbi:hypothetical protein ACFX2S_11955 [Gilliamella apicola]|nr:hypothetical protein [Gilliamella apicola]
MSQAIYLSQKSTTQPLVIFIQINKHNPNGWIEKSNGKAIKLKQVKHRQN